MNGRSQAIDAALAAKVATKCLRDLYPEQWVRVLGEERVKLGLPSKPVTGKSTSYLIERLEKIRKREEGIVADLKARGVEVE
jgi:hypothetical protein